MDRKMRYESIKHDFKINNIYKSFNGSSYKLLEKFSEGAFFMQNITSGEYLLAIGVELFKRYPVDERTTENNTEISIEWQHGRYLGKSILDIDMYSLKNEFAPEHEVSVKVR